MSHQGRKNFTEPAEQSPCAGNVAVVVFERQFFALGNGRLEVFFNVPDGICLEEESSAFEMVIEAAVVQVDRTDGRHQVVCDKNLGVDETWLVQIDVNTALNERLGKPQTDAVGNVMVVVSGKDYLDIDAAARGKN